MEIKATATPRPGHADAVVRWRALAGERAGSGVLVTRAAEPAALAPGVRVLPWHRL